MTSVPPRIQKSTGSKIFTMFKTVIPVVLIIGISLAAEIPSQTLLEKQTLKPDPQHRDPIETTAVYKKQFGLENHPVFRLEEHKNEGRARIEPVKPTGPIVRHDMLADDPASPVGESDRLDNLAVSNYGYANPVEVAYPDIPYAPGYGYGADYAANSYDLYRNNPSDYLLEPDTSTMSLLWSQVPDSRQIVGYVGRTFIWAMNSMFVLLLGSAITVGICSYTNLCSITFHGVGPIHEEMRSLMTPERLEKISHAASFVKTAIDKYQKIQKVADTASARRRRAIFN